MKNFINTYKSYFIGSLLIILGSGIMFGIIIGTFPTTRTTVTRTNLESILLVTKYSAVIWTGLTGFWLGFSYVIGSRESKEFSRNFKGIFKL